MQIENGKFYFISNNFIQKYGEKYNLMANKETGKKRPCYFCFRDKKDQDIVWFVPVSKQYEKFKEIHKYKKEKTGRDPLNFVFGEIKNIPAVFLIQNIFPTKEKYILEKYTNNNEAIEISKATQYAIISKAEKIISLEEQKNIHIAFANLSEFKQELLSE